MKKKEFKAESKRLMDLMINSIYTNKEIFLREIISNASDALDKLHYRSLTDTSIKLDDKDMNIFISVDKDKRTLTISDNGCGMTKEELEKNLGTIAKSGSLDFKTNNEKKENIDIIGQFGVGFYSAFMVASKVEVISKSYGSDEANMWVSEGIEGYEIEKAEKDNYGTDVILTIKEDTEDDEYSRYLKPESIRGLIKKYSDYITYPIQMEFENSVKKEKKNKDDKDEYETVKETDTLNSLVPLWKRNKDEIKEEEYETFYSDKFFDYEKPLAHIHNKAEGLVNFNSLLFIPSHAPYDYYSKDYEKGLQLYSNGVLIMEKCADLLPDYFSFVKGVVDSEDLSLNISREMLQQNRVLKTIANNIEKKITNELKDMLENDREKYEQFFKAFGSQIKFGTYDSYGLNKDKLKDLLLFKSSNESKYVTLKEYVERMKEDQKDIYYACGETIDKINMIPQVEQVLDKEFEVLYFTDYIDEFIVKVLMNYEEKSFINVCDKKLDLDTKEEKEEIKKANDTNKELLEIMKEAIGDDVKDVRFTNRLKNHPVCLTSEGEISVEMEKVINAMPTDDNVKAETVLEINNNHKIVDKLISLYNTDKEELKNYSKILYAQARLIEGLSIENPTEISDLIFNTLSK